MSQSDLAVFLVRYECLYSWSSWFGWAVFLMQYNVIGMRLVSEVTYSPPERERTLRSGFATILFLAQFARLELSSSRYYGKM